MRILFSRLLRRTEKITKTDMVYLSKGSFWLLLNQGLGSLLGFITAVALANLLPKEEYGIYKYLLSIAALCSIATMPGFSSAVVQAVGAGKSKFCFTNECSKGSNTSIFSFRPYRTADAFSTSVRSIGNHRSKFYYLK